MRTEASAAATWPAAWLAMAWRTCGADGVPPGTGIMSAAGAVPLTLRPSSSFSSVSSMSLTVNVHHR